MDFFLEGMDVPYWIECTVKELKGALYLEYEYVVTLVLSMAYARLD